MHRDYTFLMRLAFFFTALMLPCLARAQDDPAITGYVTRVAAPDDFDIDGYRVVTTGETELRTGTPERLTSTHSIAPILGQRCDLWGHIEDKTHSIRATRLVLPDPRATKVSGVAIIDYVPATPPGDPHRVRADGRILELSDTVLQHAFVHTATTSFPATPQSLRTNVWIEYAGERLPDGRIVVNAATLTENTIFPEEAAALKKTEYDPTAVSPDAFQSDSNRRLVGIDPTQIPPYLDKPVQDRINRIGNSLIPAYQRTLPANDPTRIHFRFQLVNEPKWYGTYALPSGIILVPWHLAHRLTDDSEFAALLAAAVATVLEKEPYRILTPSRDITVSQMATSVVVLSSPVAALPLGVIAIRASKTLGEVVQQIDRVSLVLMHDAGYDITKSPEAWWTLAVKEGKDPHRKPPWDRVRTLYAELGTTWQPADRPLMEIGTTSLAPAPPAVP